MKPREEKYSLLNINRKDQPTGGSDARIRNDLYMIGAIKLNFSNTKSTEVRLIGYEIPLVGDQRRGNCIDLIGYDAEYNPYIIELKRAESEEKLTKVISQINEYAQKITPLLGQIEGELQDKLFLKSFNLKRKIQKIILAPREYYEKNPAFDRIGSDILFCSFSGIRNTNNLVEKRVGLGYVEIMIYNKPLQGRI